MPASHPTQEPFVRVFNRSGQSGTVRIWAIDDSGWRAGPVILTLAPNAVAGVNSGDIENGNPSGGLSGATGPAFQGDWRLNLETSLDVEILSYVRTREGFMTGMHELAPLSGPGQYHVGTFNPGSNTRQVSRLRLANPNDVEVAALIHGVDADGQQARGGRDQQWPGLPNRGQWRELEEGQWRIERRFGG